MWLVDWGNLAVMDEAETRGGSLSTVEWNVKTKSCIDHQFYVEDDLYRECFNIFRNRTDEKRTVFGMELSNICLLSTPLIHQFLGHHL